VFAKVPTPGFVKTRLIPALGPLGAAYVHRRLTQWTLDRAFAYSKKTAAQLQVWFADGSVRQMVEEFGKEFEFVEQQGEDLGAKMVCAFETTFDQGAQKVVLIGSDIPEWTTDTLTQAFAALNRVDVVLGPVKDGGYYLIGMNRAHPELFEQIHWGNADVLLQTLNCAKANQIKTHLLDSCNSVADVCSDVDTPEDIVVIKRALVGLEQTDRQPIVSVIIPARNEEVNIGQTIEAAAGGRNVEVIVVDGGSTDRTAQIAADAGAKVIASTPGRALQQDLGASIASGDILLFLHADTVLPSGFDDNVRVALAKPKTVAGAFTLKIDSDRAGVRSIEKLTRFRCKKWALPYGDQALFFKAIDFFRAGGFGDMPIMEDYKLMRRIKQFGKVTVLPETVLTSGRRWDKHGVIKVTLLNQLIIFGFWLGISPWLLKKLY
jgi:hypothetical protein